ncbi:MAG: hypothetical protein WBK26_05910, partial [Burkholderiaceae bacterium]
MSRLSPRLLTLSLMAAAVATLTACGGGGGSTDSAAPKQTALSTTLMDGLIGNAKVCVDTNNNNVCDPTEVQGRTDAQGRVTLNVTGTIPAGTRLLASIGLDAVDADTGPVTTAYTLSTPIARHGVISPLTTMVQARMDSSGESLAAAEAYVVGQTGLTVSVFDDFVAQRTRSNGHKKAGEWARLWVVSTQASVVAPGAAQATACDVSSPSSDDRDGEQDSDSDRDDDGGADRDHRNSERGLQHRLID